MGIMGAEPELTMRALLGRPVMRVRCCGEPMARKDAHAHMAEGERDFAYSEVTLTCLECKREVVIDLILGSASRGRVWPVLREMQYPAQVAREMNEKARKGRDKGG